MADTTASSASGDAAAVALGSDWIKKAEDQEISTLVSVWWTVGMLERNGIAIVLYASG